MTMSFKEFLNENPIPVDQEEMSQVSEARNYKNRPDSQHNVQATVCYIDPVTRIRKCDDIYFMSKIDALGFKDNVIGFPKGAEVEAIKVMK